MAHLVVRREGREIRDKIRTLVVLQTRTLGAPEEAMVGAQIWVVGVKDHQCKVVVGPWAVLEETEVPLVEEEAEGEEVRSLKEDLLGVK